MNPFHYYIIYKLIIEVGERRGDNMVQEVGGMGGGNMGGNFAREWCRFTRHTVSGAAQFAFFII